MSADPSVVHTCPVCSKEDVKNVTYHFKSKGRTGDAFCNSCNSMFRWHIVGTNGGKWVPLDVMASQSRNKNGRIIATCAASTGPSILRLFRLHLI